MDSTTIRTRIAPLAALGLAAALAFAPAARAEDVPTAATASLTAASRYVWRGQTLSEGFVLQPSITATYGGFAANLWGNIDLDAAEEDDDDVALNETDVTLSYAVPVGPVTLTGGVIHYDFDGADTQEVFLTAAAALPLNPALTVYYDFDEGDGAFAVLALSQKFPVTDAIGVTAGGSLGANFKDAAMGVDADGKDFSGLYYGEVFLATSIPVFGRVSIDPRVAYAFGIGDGKDAIEAVSVDGEGSMFYASVAATLAF